MTDRLSPVARPACTPVVGHLPQQFRRALLLPLLAFGRLLALDSTPRTARFDEWERCLYQHLTSLELFLRTKPSFICDNGPVVFRVRRTGVWAYRWGALTAKPTLTVVSPTGNSKAGQVDSEQLHRLRNSARYWVGLPAHHRHRRTLPPCANHTAGHSR